MQKKENGKIAGVSIYQYGIFKGEPIRIFNNPTSVTGKESEVIIKGFEKRTLHIRAGLGTHFGVIYVVKGNPAGAMVSIRLRILHPPMKNPDTVRVCTSTDSTRMVEIGAHEFHGWLFEHEWEVVPGQYSFQIFDHQKELGRKTFTIYLAKIRTKPK